MLVALGVPLGLQRDEPLAHLLALAADAGIKPRSARKVLEEVAAATGRVRERLEEHGCAGAVSAAAAAAVERATELVRAP